MTCPECGSEKIIEGVLQGYTGVTFVERGTENKFFPNARRIVCKSCEACGLIFDWRTMPPKKKEKK